MFCLSYFPIHRQPIQWGIFTSNPSHYTWQYIFPSYLSSNGLSFVATGLQQLNVSTENAAQQCKPNFWLYYLCQTMMKTLFWNEKLVLIFPLTACVVELMQYFTVDTQMSLLSWISGKKKNELRNCSYYIFFLQKKWQPP